MDFQVQWLTLDFTTQKHERLLLAQDHSENIGAWSGLFKVG